MADGADLLDVGGVKAGPGEAVSERGGARACGARGRGAAGPVRCPDLGRHLALEGARCRACRRAPAWPTTSAASPIPPTSTSPPVTARRSWPRTSAWRPGCADPAPDYPDGVVDTVVRFCADRAERRRGGRHPARADHGRRRPRPRARRSPCPSSCCGRRDRLAALGYPVLLSASNKRFLGEILGLAVDDRRPGLRRRPRARASRSAAGCCGRTTCGGAGGWPMSWRRCCAAPRHAPLTLGDADRRWASCTSCTAPTSRWSARRWSSWSRRLVGSRPTGR